MTPNTKALLDAVYNAQKEAKNVYHVTTSVQFPFGNVEIDVKQGGRASGKRGCYVTTPVITFKLDGKRIARAALEKLAQST